MEGAGGREEAKMAGVPCSDELAFAGDFPKANRPVDIRMWTTRANRRSAS